MESRQYWGILIVVLTLIATTIGLYYLSLFVNDTLKHILRFYPAQKVEACGTTYETLVNTGEELVPEFTLNPQNCSAIKIFAKQDDDFVVGLAGNMNTNIGRIDNKTFIFHREPKYNAQFKGLQLYVGNKNMSIDNAVLTLINKNGQPTLMQYEDLNTGNVYQATAPIDLLGGNKKDGKLLIKYGKMVPPSNVQVCSNCL